MPRSSSGSKPILGRAMAILRLPLTPISKAKGSLVRFKKRAASAVARRRSYKPFRHCNHAYDVGEYQFSPSRSPLLPRPPPGVTAWRRAAAKKRRSRARIILASLLCGGGVELEVAVLDGLPRRQPDVVVINSREREEQLVAPALEWGCDEDACSYADEERYDAEQEEGEGDQEVDGRAERFIQRFHEEMRLQRQRSLRQRLL